MKYQVLAGLKPANSYTGAVLEVRNGWFSSFGLCSEGRHLKMVVNFFGLPPPQYFPLESPGSLSRRTNAMFNVLSINKRFLTGCKFTTSISTTGILWCLETCNAPKSVFGHGSATDPARVAHPAPLDSIVDWEGEPPFPTPVDAFGVTVHRSDGEAFGRPLSA